MGKDRFDPSPARNGGTRPPSWWARRRIQRQAARDLRVATDSLWLYTKFLRGDFQLGFLPAMDLRPRVVTPRELWALLVSQGERGWTESRVQAALEHGARDGWVRRVATSNGRRGYAVVPERFQ
jgi:hypothetical protein